MSKKNLKTCGGAGCSNAFYGLGMIGALVYFWTSSDPTFMAKVTAMFKALVWPAFFVFEAMKYLGM